MSTTPLIRDRWVFPNWAALIKLDLTPLIFGRLGFPIWRKSMLNLWEAHLLKCPRHVEVRGERYLTVQWHPMDCQVSFAELSG